ncbi:hypothetical protein ACQJBY_032423 [Aegilops geniculata]
MESQRAPHALPDPSSTPARVQEPQPPPDGGGSGLPQRTPAWGLAEPPLDVSSSGFPHPGRPTFLVQSTPRAAPPASSTAGALHQSSTSPSSSTSRRGIWAGKTCPCVATTSPSRDDGMLGAGSRWGGGRPCRGDEGRAPPGDQPGRPRRPNLPAARSCSLMQLTSSVRVVFLFKLQLTSPSLQPGDRTRAVAPLSSEHTVQCY